MEKITILAKIFSSETKKKIINLFLQNLDKEFFGKELAKNIDVTPASIYQQIDELVENNILIEIKKGRMRFFKLNKNHWLIRQLL